MPQKQNMTVCNRSDMPNVHGNARFPLIILNFHHKI